MYQVKEQRCYWWKWICIYCAQRTNTIQDVFSDIGLMFRKKKSTQLTHAKQVRKQAEETNFDK